MGEIVGDLVVVVVVGHADLHACLTQSRLVGHRLSMRHFRI